MRILVVDDDPGTLNAVRAYLTSIGHEVAPAKGGYQALRMIEATKGVGQSIDLMVTDLRMPGMDGVELIRAARRIKLRLPIILMTAHGEESIRRQTLELEACGYLEKPFTPERLLTKTEDEVIWQSMAENGLRRS